MSNQLYYGDNLQVLREHIADQSVDLIYLDPPFSSKRDYNLLFKSPKGVTSEAQIEAFEDTWHWNEQAEREFDELLHQPNTTLAGTIKSLVEFLGRNDVTAYLVIILITSLASTSRRQKPRRTQSSKGCSKRVRFSYVCFRIVSASAPSSSTTFPARAWSRHPDSIYFMARFRPSKVLPVAQPDRRFHCGLFFRTDRRHRSKGAGAR